MLDDSRGRALNEFLRRWGRRCITVPTYMFVCCIVTATLPVTIPAAARDVYRRSRLAAVRCVCFLWLHLACESLGIAAAFLNWLFSGVWLGGSLVLLESNQQAAAVFCVHVGFESVGRAKHFLDGSLIGSEILDRIDRLRCCLG